MLSDEQRALAFEKTTPRGRLHFTEEAVERIVAEQVEAARAEWLNEKDQIGDRMALTTMRLTLRAERAEAAERALVERLTKLADEWERENVWLANDVPDPKGGYRSRNRPAWGVLRAALAAVHPDTEGLTLTAAEAAQVNDALDREPEEVRALGELLGATGWKKVDEPDTEGAEE